MCSNNTLYRLLVRCSYDEDYCILDLKDRKDHLLLYEVRIHPPHYNIVIDDTVWIVKPVGDCYITSNIKNIWLKRFVKNIDIFTSSLNFSYAIRWLDLPCDLKKHRTTQTILLNFCWLSQVLAFSIDKHSNVYALKLKDTS